MTASTVIGVLALQGAFIEHISHLETALTNLGLTANVIQVRTPEQLSQCSALIIPGGESTAISLVAERTGLLEPLREYVRDPTLTVWGTCAGLILLAQEASATRKDGGQQLIGGLDVRVARNHFGRQTDSFVAALEMPQILGGGLGVDGAAIPPFDCVFIRAPIVEAINISYPSTTATTITNSTDLVQAPPLAVDSPKVRVLATLPAELSRSGQPTIVAVAQGTNILGTSFHPELTEDTRLHEWWIKHMVFRTQ